MFGTDEQKERFLPDLASGPQARRLRAHRARGGLRRLRDPVAGGRAARRLLGAERREALHRQRLEGRRLHRLRPLRGRRQGPPHRADPREGDEGLRGRRALRHDGPARQRPPAPLLQGRQGAGRERPRRARRGLQDRDADPQQRAHRARHRLGRARPSSCSTSRSTTSRSGASSAARWPTSSWSRTRSRWMVSYLFGLESMCYLTCGLVDRGVEDYSLESAICKVSGTEFLWYAANRAMQLAGGAGYMKRRALREGPARHPHLPDLRGRQRRHARVHRPLRDEAGRREALGAGRDRARRPDRLDRRAGRLRRRPDPRPGAPGPDHAGPRGALRRTPRRSPSR